jgi:uncharacterized protein involved in exopolysaccharide biosynthesis
MTGQRNTIFSSAQSIVESPERSVEPRRQEAPLLLSCAVMLWRDRRLLARIVAAGGLLTLSMTLLLHNRYESSIRLMSPEMGSGTSQMLMTGLLNRTGGLAGLGANLLGLDNTGAMFIGVLNSRTVADDLVKRFDLKKVYDVRRDQDARLALAGRTNISEDRKSEIITIAVEDTDPHRAAALAAAYVDELNDLLVQVNTTSAHRERVFIEERLKYVKPELDLATKQLSAFSTRTSTLDLKEQGKAMVEAVATVRGELIANETELRGLQQIYTGDNVRVRSLEARIAEQRHQLDLLRGGEPKETPIPADGDNPDFPTFHMLPALGGTYADLYREVKLREAVFETLTQQLEMAKIAEAKETPSVKVLDTANLPEKKSGPHRVLITLLGVIASFGFGLVFVIGRGTWKQVDPDDPHKIFAAEIWGDTRRPRAELRARALKIKAKLWHNSQSNSPSTSKSDRKVGRDS